MPLTRRAASSGPDHLRNMDQRRCPIGKSAREAPVTVYGAGLVAATQLCRSAAAAAAVFRRHGAAGACLRSSPIDRVFGALAHHAVPWPGTFDCAARRSARSYLCRRRRCGAAAHGQVAPVGRTVINIASGVAPTMREVAELVIEQTGANPDLVECGEWQPTLRGRDLACFARVGAASPWMAGPDCARRQAWRRPSIGIALTRCMNARPRRPRQPLHRDMPTAGAA